MNLPDDKYEILQPLKEGGMGAIYKVRHRLLAEIRVVKVMRPQAATDPDLQRRFLSEAKMAIRVRHPNIAQLYDFSIDPGGTAFMFMEFIDGVTLQEVLASGPPPSPPFALQIAAQVLQALECLHFSGIVHRDIASDNVMLTRSYDGRPLVKVIDLGIAKDPASEARSTVSGTFVGKARYAAPEQFRGQRADQPTPATDLYSFGVLLYELLTGRLPIEGESFAELAAGHLFTAPISFEVTDPENRIPSGLREVLLLALQKEPARRIASAQDFAERIRPYAAPDECDPLELSRLLERVRSPRSTAAGPPGDANETALAEGPSHSQINTIVDAIVTSSADTEALEILEALHDYGSQRESVQEAPPPRPAWMEVNARDSILTHQPRRAARPASREAGPAVGTRPREAGYRAVTKPRPNRTLAVWVAAVLLLLGAAGVAIWRTLQDPLTSQITNALGLPEETEAQVIDKLNQVAGLHQYMPGEHPRKRELQDAKERLGHLQELWRLVGRLSEDDTGNLQTVVDDATLHWKSLTDSTEEKNLARDSSAQRVLEHGRRLLGRIAEKTDSNNLRKLAEEK